MHNLLLISFLTSADAGYVTVEASGEAAIFNNDAVQAREKALEDALRNAVEKAVGTVITSESQTRDFELVEDRVLSHARGFVKKYDVLSKKEFDGTVTVQIRAEIGKDALEKDVDAALQLLARKGKPKILIMVAEQNIGQPTAQAWWTNQGFTTNMDTVENTFIDTWGPQGFNFVDPQALKGKITVTNAIKSPNVPDSAAKEFAGKAGAQVVIVGKAVAQEATSKAFDTNMKNVRANLSVRAIRTDTGDILATSTTDAAGLALDSTTAGNMAFKEVTRRMADDLKVKIMQKWLGEVSGGQSINVRANNVKTMKQLKALRAALTTQIRGVSAVRERSYAKKVAELEVDAKGSGQDIATELEAKSFPDFKVEIDEVTANSLEITLK